MAHKTVLLALAIFAATLTIVFANPPKQRQEGEDVAHENLKFTFDNTEDIPSAFFDTDSDRSVRQNRRVYRACQDGSGGMCVLKNECPVGLKPTEQPSNSKACEPNEECCYGFPTTETSCEARGGECMSGTNCGNRHHITQATSCGAAKSCCVLTF